VGLAGSQAPASEDNAADDMEQMFALLAGKRWPPAWQHALHLLHMPPILLLLSAVMLA
jgi:hypothetical protein